MIWKNGEMTKEGYVEIDGVKHTVHMPEYESETPLTAENLNRYQIELEELLLNKMYPIGAIYMSTRDVNPSELFGGTWQRWGSGRVPVGVNESDIDFNSVEKTGGSKSHSYTPSGSISKLTGNTGSTTLTVNQIPGHNHSMGTSYKVNGWGLQQGSGGYSDFVMLAGAETAVSKNMVTTNTGGSQGHNHSMTHEHTFTGSASTQGRVQPYITCYMWKRTA